MPITLAHSAPARLDWHRHAALGAPLSPRAGTPALRPDDETQHDAAFLALQAGYRSHRGIAQGESLAGSLGRAGRGGYVDLARGIVAGELFSFRWHDTFWVPLFQFDPALLTLRAAPRRVLDELHGVLDGWDIASWYVRAHEDLQGRRPLDLLDSELAAVLAAARAERHTADA